MRLQNINLWTYPAIRSIFPNKQNAFGHGDGVVYENTQQSNPPSNTEVDRTYAVTSPNFRHRCHPKDGSVQIITIPEPLERSIIKLEIDNVPENIPQKQGVFGLYSFILNDVMVDSHETRPKVTFEDSYIKRGGRRIIITCPPEMTEDVVKYLADSFVDTKFDKKYLDEAKQIAPVGLFLNRKADAYQEHYKDIPKDMSEEDYTKLVNNITEKDINDYNKSFLENSKIDIQLVMNEDDYKKNPIEGKTIKSILNI